MIKFNWERWRSFQYVCLWTSTDPAYPSQCPARLNFSCLRILVHWALGCRLIFNWEVQEVSMSPLQLIFLSSSAYCRLAGGGEALRWRTRLVPSPTSRVHFKFGGPCTEPQGSPSSQDCQTAAGGTASLAIWGKNLLSSWISLPGDGWLRKPAVEAFGGPETWPSGSPRASSVPCSSTSLHFVLGRGCGVTSHWILGFPFLTGKGAVGPEPRHCTPHYQMVRVHHLLQHFRFRAGRLRGCGPVFPDGPQPTGERDGG